MDAEKILRELAEGEFGDQIREQFLQSILADLEDYASPSGWSQEMTPEGIDRERAWATSTAEWLRENYL